MQTNRVDRLMEMLEWALTQKLDPNDEETATQLHNYARDVFLTTKGTANDYAEAVLRTLRARLTGLFD